jgi:CRISPR-associated endonuclease Cas3-HD
MYYAHSPYSKKCIPAQPYEQHISEVLRRAKNAAAEAGKYAASAAAAQDFLKTVELAAQFHDLGKLDIKNQEILSRKNSAKSLPVQHTDAGTAHLLDNVSYPAALAIQAHHIGYPDFITEQEKEQDMFRDTEKCEAVSKTVQEHIDETLPGLLSIHHALLKDSSTITPIEALSGNQQVALRMVLSCLADADHTDSALNESKYFPSETIIPLRPAERLKKLDRYIENIAANKEKKDERWVLRQEMYRLCQNAEIESVKKIVSCDSPVGSGKTTAVMAHLLRQAKKRDLRRIFVVLPVTNIIKQSVATVLSNTY